MQQFHAGYKKDGCDQSDKFLTRLGICAVPGLMGTILVCSQSLLTINSNAILDDFMLTKSIILAIR